MPRTAAFYKSLEAAFGDEECPIEQERASALSGVLMMNDRPYGCDALLRWMDEGGTHPLTRAPLSIDEMHPVMTPQTPLAVYTRTVRALAEHGWDHADEVEADLDLRRPGWKRDREGKVLHHPLDAMRGALEQNLWWYFTHTPNKRLARREIDLRLLHRALGEGANAVRYVACFLENRRRMWRFPPGDEGTPIYMHVDVLASDLAAICQGLTLDQLGRLVHNAAHTGRGFAMAYDRTAAGAPRVVLALYAPTPVEWVKHVAVPMQYDTDRAWWRLPHRLEDIGRRLAAMQAVAPVDFSLPEALLCNAARHCMHRGECEFYTREPTDTPPWGPVDVWLRQDMAEATQPIPDATYEGHAYEIQRRRGDACPYSLDELRAAVQRVYRAGGVLEEGYCFTYQQFNELRTLPELLPGRNPYEEPRALVALRYGLQRIAAEARGGAP